MPNSFNISVKPEIAAVKTVVDANKVILLDVQGTKITSILTAIGLNKTELDGIRGADLTSILTAIGLNKTELDGIRDADLTSILTEIDANETKIDANKTAIDLIKVISDALSSTPKTANAGITLATFSTVIEVASGSGFLVSINAVSRLTAATTCNIKITIDGTPLGDVILASQTGTDRHCGSGLTCLMRYTTSLKVEAKLGSADGSAEINVSYTEL